MIFRPRVIPCLLLKNRGLVKTVKFKNPVYVGDPINAVKLFNDYRADELVFLDIGASVEGRSADPDFVRSIAEEAFMPFAVGGGIRSSSEAGVLLKTGAEKVVINTAAYERPELVSECADLFGSQSVIVSIDVGKNFWGKESVSIRCGSSLTGTCPVEYALKMQKAGAGEILINSISKDGTMTGYDLELVKRVSSALTIPVIAIGGAGSAEDFRTVVREGGASAAAAGSLFVFHGPKRGVLINYPDEKEFFEIFSK